MRINTYSFPKSSFLAVEKDYNIIISQFLKNERLKKLLYYNTSDALDKENLSQDESFSLLGKQIKIVPKINVDQSEWCYIYIKHDEFMQNPTNPKFRSNYLVFIIVCHFDQWSLKNFELRPFKIAAEIDSMFNNKHLSGIGLTRFISADETVMTDEFGALTLTYEVMHGYDGEDSKYPLNPKEQENININWDNLFNYNDEL